MAKKLNEVVAVRTPRKLRADAQENRERILEVAKDAFLASGPDVSLDEIAKLAAVGPGTLYRHFPTRDALVEAVYRTQVAKLSAAATTFSETMPPMEALRSWMLLFVDYMAAKQIILPALNLMTCGTEEVFAASVPLIAGAITLLVTRAVESGDIREDVDGMDMLRAVAGLSAVSPTADWPVSAKKMVEILLVGSARLVGL